MATAAPQTIIRFKRISKDIYGMLWKVGLIWLIYLLFVHVYSYVGFKGSLEFVL
jgi:hypothetical protein